MSNLIVSEVETPQITELRDLLQAAGADMELYDFELRAMAGMSGLGLHDRRKARALALGAAKLGLHRASSLHYTQEAPRWQGINSNLKAYLGQCPHYADCSSFQTWCLWNGLSHFHVGDVVNGAAWRAGFTGTMLRHGARVTGTRAYMDQVIYGNGGDGKHVAGYVGGGMVISHGSEGGPYFLNMHYRGDIMSVRRYI